MYKLNENPKIKFNGVDLQELLERSFEINVNFSVESSPKIEILANSEAFEIEDIETNFVDIVLISKKNKKAIKKFKLVEAVSYLEV